MHEGAGQQRMLVPAFAAESLGNHKAKTARDAHARRLRGCEGQRHHDGRCGLLGQQAGHAGALAVERLQQRAGNVGRGGQDHRVKTICTAGGGEPPAPAIRLDPQHRLAQAHRSGRQPRNHAIDQRLQPTGEGGEDGLRGLLRAPLHSLDKAALLGFHADEGGHDGANTELRDIASKDRGQQRTGNGAGDFLSKVAAHKVGHRFVMSRARMP